MRTYDEADLKAVTDELTRLRDDIAMRGDRPNQWRAAVASLEAKAETIERCLCGYHTASRGPVPGRQRQMIELGVPYGTGFEARLERSRGEAKR